VYPKTPNSHCEPNWEVVNDLLQKKHMTLQLVYDEYCRMNAGQKTYSYSSFCRRYADKKPNWEPQDLFTNLHYVTGDVMEIDFALVLVTLSTIPREPCRKVKVFDEVMHVVGQSGSSHVVVRICLRSSLDFSDSRLDVGGMGNTESGGNGDGNDLLDHFVSPEVIRWVLHRLCGIALPCVE
jgi:hypothetical protein